MSPAAALVADYGFRLNLARIAKSNLDELDCFHAHCFGVVADEIERIKADAMKAARRRRR